MAVIVCPICSTRYRVTDAQLSKASRLKCKKCKTVFPVSENLRDEQAEVYDDTAAASTPESETSHSSNGLDFPDSQTLQSPSNQSEAADDDSRGRSSDDMTLDFNFVPGGDAPVMDFSFNAVIPDAPEEGTEDDVALEDHIADSLHSDHGELDIGLGGLSLSDGPDNGETTLSMDGGGSGLDFSFSAVMPEAPPDEEDEAPFDDERDDAQDSDGTSDDGMSGLSLGLDPDSLPDDATMTMSDTPSNQAPAMNLDISLVDRIDDDAGDHDDGAQDGDGGDRKELDTCCIDSMAMGMTTCELCGRDLQGTDSQKIIKQRREQLRGELPEGESQIVFSEDGGHAPAMSSAADDDFSDVERALDALADGSFEKEIKKRKAQQFRGQRLKLFAVGAVLGAIVIIGGGVLLLPSSHDRLVGQYEELMAKPDVDPKMLVTLFLDAVAKQDRDIFQRVSVMPAMPDITGGSVLKVGEDYEQTSLGRPGKDVANLEAELASLQTTYQNTEKQWQEASAVDLSPHMIKGNIDQLLKKQAALHMEFNEKEQASLQKTMSLQADIQEAEQELEANRLRAQQYLDATDKQGKAMYTASVRNQQSLSDKLGKLEGLLADERVSHANRMRVLEGEYAPQFQKAAEELAAQQAFYEKALLYADSEKSPIIVLDAELKRLKNTIAETEELLKQKQQQLAAAFDFFKRRDRRQQVEQYGNEAEFTHVSKNVLASVKFRTAGKQQVPIVLKRYQAIVGEQTIQGDWVVETVLR